MKLEFVAFCYLCAIYMRLLPSFAEVIMLKPMNIIIYNY